MTDTARIIAEHPELVARVADGDGDALRELLDIVAAADRAGRHIFVDWNRHAGEVRPDGEPTVVRGRTTGDGIGGLGVGDRVVCGDGELEVSAEVTAIDGEHVALRIDTWPAPVDVVSVRVVEGTTVELVFDDGATRTRDLGPIMWGPVFAPMRNDPAVFAEVFVDPDLGTIAWPNGADVSPELLRYDDLWEARRTR